jgi:uncharacterized membrane protein
MKGIQMQSIRTFFIAVSAISIMALTTVLTMSLAVILFAVVATGSIIRMVSQQLRSQPIPARAKAQPQPRVWNDGKGPIIDL